MMYERLHPERPWLTPAANAYLDALIRPSDRGLEWGSGRSTLWFARRLDQLTSVESDSSWYERVRRGLDRHDLGNVDYRFARLEPRDEPERSPYVNVAQEFEDRSLDFVLVDGDYREHCALGILPKISPGGILVLDNSNWYLDRPTRSPASRTGLGPLNPMWREFEQRVASWRELWTTSGVTDTALWIRTC